MEKINLSRIPLGGKFEYQNQIFIKTNHNRGLYQDKKNVRQFTSFKKDTQVQYQGNLKDL